MLINAAGKMSWHHHLFVSLLIVYYIVISIFFFVCHVFYLHEAT